MRLVMEQLSASLFLLVQEAVVQKQIGRLQECVCVCECVIGGGSRRATRPRGAMAPLTLHRNLIFAIENHLSLAKWPLRP